jgi:SNF2 family DNA or RNA helicase
MAFQKLNSAPAEHVQEGINWMAFLRRFGLHGVLADDMVGCWHFF